MSMCESMCEAYVPSSSPLMLFIGGTTIATGNNQAQRVNNASCFRLTNKHQ